MSRPSQFRSLASKFFLLTAALVFWVVAVIIAYDLRQDTFDVSKGVLLCVVVLLVSGAISRLTIRLLARPLTQLHEGMLAVQAGKLAPIAGSRTNDEIESLGHSFNTMIHALATTQAELRKSNELLEERIRQRTGELEIAMQDALAASRTKSEFLANMSHELRTPMNGVLGMVNIVLESELTPAQRDSLETAQRCAYSLLAILNDLLDFSKIEAGRMALESIPFEIRTILTDCTRTYLVGATQKGIELRTEIDPALPTVVEGDPLRLRQILTNLVSNAVKFTDTGSVVVRAGLEQPEKKRCVRVRIEVQDTGIGIAADKQAEIFESFTQADNSISRRYGGTGLGLAITRSLVEIQGGTLRLQSTPGVGSLFSCVIDYGAHCEADAQLPLPRSNAPHILLVEDNSVNQKLVSAILEKKGYEVSSAHNGAEALALMDVTEFRLVLMDVQMPVMDGIEATRRIRDQRRFDRVPVIAMTARAMDGDREACLAAGMSAFVTKPIHAAHLLSVVEEYTSSPQADAAGASS